MTGKLGKILIVDDEEIIRALLKRRLSSDGYHCQEAGSAEEALEKLRGDTVELAILDIKMPGKTGVELLPEIKANYPDIAIIMATAVTNTSIAIQCMKQGAYDYVIKPFDMDEIILSVERALETRRLELEIRNYQQYLEQRVEEQTSRVRASFLKAITSLAYALEAKDHYTSGHSQRVSHISVVIARELDLPQDDVERIRLAGLVHDIGKMGVKELVLNKPGCLSEEEFQHVKYHPAMGEHILTPIVDDEEILMIVRYHHERYDGQGYPDGLSGEQIPLGARIMAVADSYDAMISERPYRSAMSSKKAYSEIARGRGTQYSPEVVDAFMRIGKLELLSPDVVTSGAKEMSD